MASSTEREIHAAFVAACVDNGTEYIEVRKMNSRKSEMVTLMHHEAPVGYAILDLMYADLEPLKSQILTLQELIKKINNRENAETHLEDLNRIAEYWLHQGAVFALLAAAVEQMHIAYQEGEQLSSKLFRTLAGQYMALQIKIEHVCSFLTSYQGEDPMTAYLVLSVKNPTQYPALSYGRVTLLQFMKHQDFSYYDSDPLDQYAERIITTYINHPDYIAAEFLTTLSIRDMISYLVAKYLAYGLRYRTCKYCGKLFGITTDDRPDYCHRKIEGSDKTCREAGPLRLYEQRVTQNPVIREYKRSYKAHYARIRYGLMTQEEFSRWAVEAREKRDQCLDGRMSLDGFVKWLDSDSIKNQKTDIDPSSK